MSDFMEQHGGSEVNARQGIRRNSSAEITSQKIKNTRLSLQEEQLRRSDGICIYKVKNPRQSANDTGIPFLPTYYMFQDQLDGQNKTDSSLLRQCEELCDGEMMATRDRKQRMTNFFGKVVGEDQPIQAKNIPNIAVIGSGGAIRAMTAMSSVFCTLHDLDLLQYKLCAIPNIAVIGSGGGVRALTAMSSVFCTLYELDLLQYILYVAGLSGSTWYLTTLYSHKDWPNIHPRKVHEEIKERVVGGLLNKVVEILNIPGHIFENFFQGRPQNLTGIFGHSLSSNLIPDRYDTTWSNQRKKVEDGRAPFPILSCIHVKSDIPAKKFHEWIEISPYEVAIPKYGVRLDTKYFGSKFNLGKVEEIFDEIPLHYINGICGSAFTMLDDEMEQPTEADGKDGTGLAMENFKQVHIDVVDDVSRESHYMYNNTEYTRTRLSNPDSIISISKQYYNETYDELDGGSENLISELLPDCIRSFLLDKRGYRAAWINNPLKNLSFEKQSRYIKTCSTDKNVGGMFKKAENKEQMCITDAGLAFNSPYPLVLRASRSVDLILSFDFTDRGAVNGDPFTEVRLAQTWAEDHKAKFPPVPKFDETQPVKELYILEDENDPLCPVIMHFVLINRDFKIFSSPGVKRQTRSDVRYAEFDLFEDKSCPYNCTNFKYTNAEFDKLSELVRFIVLNHEDEIKKQIKKVYGRRAKTT